MGKGITNMLTKANPKCGAFFTFGGKVVIMGSIENRLIESIKGNYTYIRGKTSEAIKGCVTIQRLA
jgi:glutamate synthase domain-containing protein 3